MTFGVEAGAQKYRRPASEMTEEQSALLICLLPAPSQWTPSTPRVQRRARRVLSYEVDLPEGMGSH
jgi:membrane peptidoglycan carboxypeptidase